MINEILNSKLPILDAVKEKLKTQGIYTPKDMPEGIGAVVKSDQDKFLNMTVWKTKYGRVIFLEGSCQEEIGRSWASDVIGRQAWADNGTVLIQHLPNKELKVVEKPQKPQKPKRDKFVLIYSRLAENMGFCNIAITNDGDRVCYTYMCDQATYGDWRTNYKWPDAFEVGYIEDYKQIRKS